MPEYVRQQGFLAILAVVLVVIMGFIGMSAASQFTSNSQAMTNELRSVQAFYLATSGLEYAMRAIAVNATSCEAINGAANYTNAVFTGSSGVFTVTGNETAASSTLNGNLSANATSIALAGTSGFASSGVVTIDSESMAYTSISGNTLNNVIRGVLGTTAASHANGASVSETQCLLNSTGGVESLSSPLGKRTLQTVLVGTSFSVGSYNGQMLMPAYTSTGSLSLSGNAKIINPEVTAASSNFQGSTIVSSSHVVFNGNGKTMIDSNNGLVTSSSSGNIENDLIQNYKDVSTANLFSKFFNVSKASMQASANQSYNSSNIDGVTGQVIWMNNALSLSGNTTIGSPGSPVILIVNNNVNISGNVDIYGFLYVMQGLNLSGNVNITGGAAAEGALNSSGNVTIMLDKPILNKLNLISSRIAMQYGSTPAFIQEIF